MKISELSKLTRISTHRIRRYEALGLIKSTRTSNYYREFSESVVREVVFISMARECGFSINSIAEYLPKFRTETLTAQEMIEAIKKRIQEVNEVIKTQMALREKLEGWGYGGVGKYCLTPIKHWLYKGLAFLKCL